MEYGNYSNQFLKKEILQQQTKKVEEKPDEKNTAQSQEDKKEQDTNNNEQEFQERGNELLDAQNYIAMQRRVAVRRTARTVNNVTPKETPKVINRVTINTPNIRRRQTTTLSPLPSIPVVVTPAAPKIENIGGSIYADGELANGLVGDRYYEYGQLAIGQVDDVIYEEGMVCSDLAQTSIENIKKEINNAVKVDDNFKDFIEGDSTEETFTSTLSFNINEKIGSAEITIDKEGNILEINNGLLITYSKENPEEIQNKEIFDIDENGIWNYTKENYGVDFAGNYSLLYSWSATNEVKSSSSINAEGADETATIAGIGSTKETTSSNPVSTSVNTQAIPSSKEEMNKVIFDGFDSLQNEAKKIEDKYKSIQESTINELRNEAYTAFHDVTDKLDYEAINNRIIAIPHSDEEIKAQKSKVNELENTLTSLQNKPDSEDYSAYYDNYDKIQTVQTELEQARQELDGMKMDNEMQAEKIKRFNNRDLDFSDSYTENDITYSYSRTVHEMEGNKTVFEEYTVEYNETKITAYFNQNDEGSLTFYRTINGIKTEGSMSFTTADYNYEYYDSDSNITKKITVNNNGDLTTASIKDYRGDSISETSIKSGTENGSTIDKCLITTTVYPKDLYDIQMGDLQKSFKGYEIIKKDKKTTSTLYEDEYKVELENEESDFCSSSNANKFINNQLLENYSIINTDTGKLGITATINTIFGKDIKDVLGKYIMKSKMTYDDSYKYFTTYALGLDSSGNNIGYKTFESSEEILRKYDKNTKTLSNEYHKKVSEYELQEVAGQVITGSNLKKSVSEWTLDGEPLAKIVTTGIGTKQVRQVISSGKVKLETVRDTSLDCKRDGIVYNVNQGGVGDCWLLTGLWWLGTQNIDLTKNFGDKDSIIQFDDETGDWIVNLYEYSESFNFDIDSLSKNYQIGSRIPYRISQEEIDSPIYLDHGKTIELCTGDKTAKAMEIAILKAGGEKLLDGGEIKKFMILLFGNKNGIYKTNPTKQDLINALTISISDDKLKELEKEGVVKFGKIKDMNTGVEIPILEGHAYAIEPGSVDNPPGTITIRNPHDNGDKIYTISLEFVMKYMTADVPEIDEELQAKLEKMKSVVQYNMELGAYSR